MKARRIRPLAGDWFDVPDDPTEQDDVIQGHHLSIGAGLSVFVRIKDDMVERWDVAIYETDSGGLMASRIIQHGIHRVHPSRIHTEQEAMSLLAERLDAPWLAGVTWCETWEEEFVPASFIEEKTQ